MLLPCSKISLTLPCNELSLYPVFLSTSVGCETLLHAQVVTCPDTNIGHAEYHIILRLVLPLGD